MCPSTWTLTWALCIMCTYIRTYTRTKPIHSALSALLCFLNYCLRYRHLMQALQLLSWMDGSFSYHVCSTIKSWPYAYVGVYVRMYLPSLLSSWAHQDVSLSSWIALWGSEIGASEGVEECLWRRGGGGEGERAGYWSNSCMCTYIRMYVCTCVSLFIQ